MTSLISSIQEKLNLGGTSTTPTTGQKALLLGAGFVTKPTVEILAKSGVEVTVGKL